jgi:hypothetical protein
MKLFLAITASVTILAKSAPTYGLRLTEIADSTPKLISVDQIMDLSDQGVGFMDISEQGEEFQLYPEPTNVGK